MRKNITKYWISDFLYIIFLSLFAASTALASPPPLRQQVSLNGIWSFTPEGASKTTIPVPEYWDAAPRFKEVSQAVYESEVTVPSSWKGKIIKVEFEGINHIADVYINGKYVVSHVGGWIPFSADISKLVKPGSAFTIRVEVKGGSHQPIVDENGNPLWPVGWFGQNSRWGIIFDVWMRAYGKVHIEDAFIQTSYRNMNLKVDYTLKNSDTKSHTVAILLEVVPEGGDEAELMIDSPTVTLQPGEEKKVIVSSKWGNPNFWTPDDPHLYILNSKLLEKGKKLEVDNESRRFGFREIWISRNRLIFNGHRINMLGTSIHSHGQGYNRARYQYMLPENWNDTIDILQELNIRTVRFHQQPAPSYVLDIADERGLIIIEESPMYAREYILDCNNTEYFKNCLTWIEPWVKSRRNHPSVLMWSSENEMGRNWLKWLSDGQIKELAETIRLYDPTRPVINEGDFDVNDDWLSYHYPENVNKTVSGSIYSWLELVSPDKPTGIGEFLYTGNPFGEENKWWHGTWSRGMRYVNISEILPYTLGWSWSGDPTTPRAINAKNALAPVALFDKEYDDLGIDPLMNENYPELVEGNTVNRTLILYNDEYDGSLVSIEVKIKSNNSVYATGRNTFTVPLGEHIDIPYSFQVPDTEGSNVEVVLITRKKGMKKFEEAKWFKVNESDFSGISSNVVVIGESKESDYK